MLVAFTLASNKARWPHLICQHSSTSIFLVHCLRVQTTLAQAVFIASAIVGGPLGGNITPTPSAFLAEYPGESSHQEQLWERR